MNNLPAFRGRLGILRTDNVPKVIWMHKNEIQVLIEVQIILSFFCSEWYIAFVTQIMSKYDSISIVLPTTIKLSGYLKISQNCF